MKKWRSPLIIIVAVLFLSILFFFVPLDSLVKGIPVLRGFYKNTSLEIVTPNGKSLVKINGKDYGETPLKIESLVAGSYEVELTRVSQEEYFYNTHTFRVEMTKNTTSRINMEIGPGDNLHGFVLYYTQVNTLNSGNGQLTVTSSADGTKIYLDSEYLDTAPLTNLDLAKGEYTIEIRGKDFEDLSFPVNIEGGYILNIKGYQFPLPISFESAKTDG